MGKWKIITIAGAIVLIAAVAIVVDASCLQPKMMQPILTHQQ